MSGKILLIAHDEHFAELYGQGELPESWWTDVTAATLVQHVERAPPWLLRCGPQLLVPGEEDPESQAVDPRDRAEFINGLLDGTICYLAVVDGGEPVGNGASAPAQDLAQVADWYQRWRQQLQHQAGHREVHLRHILLLVCRQDPSGAQFEAFQRLAAGSGQQRLFDLCYIMLEQIEPGRGMGQLFHTEHIWPLAVSHLLLKLLHDDPRLPVRGPTRTYAWRSYQLATELDAGQQQTVCAAQFQRLLGHLTASRAPAPDWDLGQLAKYQPRQSAPGEVQLPELREQDDFGFRHWLEVSASKRLDQVRSDSRWEAALLQAGHAVGQQFTQEALDQEPPPCREGHKIWGSVHQDPRFLYTALQDRNVIRTAALEDQFETITRHWQQILETDRRREVLIERAQQCTDHFGAAQRGFVTLLWRLAAVLAVSLAVGYVAMVVLHFLLGTWLLPAGIAATGALGALLAGLITLDAEERAGRRAQAALQQQLRAIDQQVRQRHGCCQKAVASAHVFWQQLWSRAAAQRLKQWLRRVQQILDQELQYRPDPADEPPGGAVPLSEPAAATDPPGWQLRRAGQQLRYRQAARVSQMVQDDVLQAIAQDEDLDRLVQEQAERFRNDLWSAFCQQYDPQRCGNLPARHLVPLVRQFRDRFQAALLQRIRRLAVQRLRQQDRDQLGSRIKEIVDYQQYFELMSCRMLVHHTAPAESRPLPRLYLRRDFQHPHLKTQLASATLATDFVISDYLDNLPLVGFLYQELPVQFQDSNGTGNGKITLATYHPAE